MQVLITVTLATLLNFFFDFPSLYAPELKIDNGVLNLREPLSSEMRLKGQWNFYANSAISSTEIGCPLTRSQLLHILDFWRYDFLEKNPAWAGTSSFCIEIENPSDQELILWWPNRISIDIYANGELVYGFGKLVSKSQSYPTRQPGLVHLPKAKRIKLVIHANNDFANWSKTNPPLTLGPKVIMERQYIAANLRDMFIATALLVTAFFQLSLFSLQRSRLDSALLSLFCLGITARFISIGRNNLDEFFLKDILGLQIYSIGYVGYYIAAASYYHFLCISFPKFGKKSLQVLLWSFALLFSAAVLIWTNRAYAETLLVFHMIAGLGMLSGIHISLKAVWQRESGSIPLAIGTIIMSITAIHDMSLSQGLSTNIELFPFGQIVFVLSSAILVSIRYANIFKTHMHLSHELSKMVPIHVIDNISAGKNLEVCMPTGEQEAIILVFDIVGSSKLQSPEFKATLESCMGQLHERINLGYDPKTLNACAYRLKEMGDGLICTIGFPYQMPDPGPIESHAIKLAKDLCSIFHKSMAVYSPNQAIYCGIGMVKGTIEAYFPSSGPKLYDLRGYPLVLATRYESMRNLVYKKFGKIGSVIFIHDQIYEHLPQYERSTFQLWDATLPDQMIRDDINAKRAWYMIIPWLPTDLK